MKSRLLHSHTICTLKTDNHKKAIGSLTLPSIRQIKQPKGQILKMITNRQQLQYHARTLQSRATAMTALFMTIFLLCIEHVRSFANQYHISAHDAMVLASAAGSLRRKLSKTYLSPDTLKKSASFGGFFSSPGRSSSSSNGEASRSSATKLNAWSMGSIASMSSIAMPTMPTSKDIPLHALGSWYTSVDPTTKPPVYDE